MSGVIAYEIARQLLEKEEEVALLVLLDSNSPEYNRQFRTLRAYPIRLYFYYTRYMHHIKLLLRQPPGEKFIYLRQRTQSKLALWKKRFRIAFGRKTILSPDDDLIRVSHLIGLAAASYEPKPTTVPMVLFRSAVLQTGWFKDPALGWSNLAMGGLSVHELPGGHADMFVLPAVEQLALHLSRALERVAEPQAVVNSPEQFFESVNREQQTAQSSTHGGHVFPEVKVCRKPDGKRSN